MSRQAPRPGQAHDPVDAAVVAGRGPVAPEEADPAARRHWEAEAEAYQAAHGAFLAGGRGAAPPCGPPGGGETRGSAFVWGPEGVTEEELGMLGPAQALLGRRVLEVGCGAAQCTAWLVSRGVRAVGLDIAVNQLRLAPGRPPSLSLVAGTATALPFADARFDAAFASYGAVQFVADLGRLLREVRRVLRPGGVWAYSVSHPIRWAFPDVPGHAGLTASGSYFDRTPYVERDGLGRARYAEFHHTLGDHVRALEAAGFRLERLVEPEWPPWNTSTWGGWSPLRGAHLPGTLILGCRADGALRVGAPRA